MSPRRIALLQSDVEVLSTPSTDLRELLSGHPSWDVELFTDATVSRLATVSDFFDCIVVAEDATIHRPETLKVLRSLQGMSIVVLRQRQSENIMFLDSLPEIREEVAESPKIRAVANEDEEVLLRWPNTVDPANLQASRIRFHFDLSRSARFVPVFRSDIGVCLFRTNRGATPRQIVSTVGIPIWSTDGMALVLNMVNFALEGSPETVVVGHEESQLATSALAQNLQIQGSRAIQLDARSLQADGLRQWPISHASTLICTSEVLDRLDPEGSGRNQWLRRDARLVLLDDDGSLTFQFGLRDPNWLALRWASWFHSLPDEAWIGLQPSKDGSILRSRSVLRVIEQIHATYSSPDPEHLQIPSVDRWKERVVHLVARRVRSDGSVDNEVGVSCAALDLLRIVGADHSDIAERIQKWLVSQIEHCSLGDRVAAAVSLDQLPLLEGVYEELLRSSKSDPLRRAQLRNAMARHQFVPSSITNEATEHELRTSPLLAAEYIAALAPLSVGVEESGFADAIYSIQRFGSLSGGHADPWPEPIEPNVVAVNTEALALLRMFEVGRFPAHPIVASSDGQTVSTIVPLVGMANRLHADLDESREREHLYETQLAQAAEALRRGQHFIGSVFALSSLAAVVTVVVFWRQQVDVMIAVLAPMMVLLIGFVAVIGRLGLAPPWLTAFGRLLARGRAGIRDAFEQVLGRPESS